MLGLTTALILTGVVFFGLIALRFAGLTACYLAIIAIGAWIVAKSF